MLWGNEEEERWEQHHLYGVSVQAESPRAMGWELKGRQGHREPGPGFPEPAWSCSEMRTKLLHQVLSESEDLGTWSISQGALSLLHQARQARSLPGSQPCRPHRTLWVSRPNCSPGQRASLSTSPHALFCQPPVPLRTFCPYCGNFHMSQCHSIKNEVSLCLNSTMDTRNEGTKGPEQILCSSGQAVTCPWPPSYLGPGCAWTTPE